MTYDKARVLSEALPYIQKYRGKTVVVKYGGSAMSGQDLKDAVIADIVLLSLVGISVVVVHGGGPEINERLRQLGVETKFINGLRYTDGETMRVVREVLCGRVNKELVSLIGRRGGRAAGLCGLDGGLLKAVRLVEEGVDYGLVGEIKEIDPGVVNMALASGYIPVIATVALGLDGEDAYNINADTAAAKLAVALGAEKLILLTDVRGILRDPKDESTLIPAVRIDEVPGLFSSGVITGGFIPKVECCVDAVKGGVARTHILDGRLPHAILVEMLSDEGVGTMIE